MANRLLGREYAIDGEVIAGQGLGSKELVPTLNLRVAGYQLPAEGVYASRTLVEGQWMESVTFLGHRVTTDGSFAVETHVLDRNIGIVTGRVFVAFVAPIRANRTFASLKALREQITEDIAIARGILDGR